MKRRTWHFVDKYTGEEFFVENPSKTAAIEEAKKYFDFPVLYGEIPIEIAEIMGYDTY